jgi:hypothetical protein
MPSGPLPDAHQGYTEYSIFSFGCVDGAQSPPIISNETRHACSGEFVLGRGAKNLNLSLQVL